MTPVIGGAGGRAYARPMVNAHEDLPLQVSTKAWIPSPLRPIISRAAKCLLSIAERVLNRVIAATPSIAETYRHAIVVQNFPLMSELPLHRRNAYASRERVVAYVGAITEVRGARQMIEAVGLLPSGFQPQLELAGAGEQAGEEHEHRSRRRGDRSIDHTRERFAPR